MGIEDWGERLRTRARELGLTDSDVARRVGLTQRRYSSYVNMSREPGFRDLLRICEGLGVTPNFVLGVDLPSAHDDGLRRAGSALGRMSDEQRTLALAALDGMADAAERVATLPGQRQPARRARGTRQARPAVPGSD